MQRRFDKVFILLIYLFLGHISRVSPPMRFSYDTLVHVYMVTLRHCCPVAQVGGGRAGNARAITPSARAIAHKAVLILDLCLPYKRCTRQ